MTDSISRLKLAYMVATPDIESREALGYHGDINYSTKLLRELGYDGIELTTADPDAFGWGAVQAAIEAAGLDVPLVCSGEVFGQSKLGLAAPDNVINGFKHKRFYAIRSVLHGSLGIAPGGLGFPET